MITKKPHLLLNKNFIIVTLITLSAVAAISAVTQKTQTQQQASTPPNINTSNELELTDNTTAPENPSDNFSYTLPPAYLGKINLNLNAPQQDNQIPLIKLTIAKAEIHLIYLFLPGTTKDNTKTLETKNINGQKTNQNLDKWETLKPTSNTLRLKAGETTPLATTNLSGGKYSEIRIYIKEATATSSDGKEIPLTIPGNSNIIRIVKPFNIYPEKTTTLTLDIDTKRSIVQSGTTYFLQPVITNLTATSQ